MLLYQLQNGICKKKGEVIEVTSTNREKLVERALDLISVSEKSMDLF